jgi:3',5'-cyclic AMP phosphodiesterase CpdA
VIALWVGCTGKLPAVPPAEPALEPGLRFAVLGDRADEPNDGAWRAVVAQVAARQPDFVLTVGDLVDDSLDPADWDTALGSLSGLDVEHAPGNHDLEDEATAAIFRARTGQEPLRSFERGGVHFVVVNNAIAETWEQLPEADRAWLVADLAAAADRLVVVSMHKPFWAVGVASGRPDPMHELLVAQGVDLVLTGHWHHHLAAEVDGVRYVGIGTSGGAYLGVPSPRLGNAYEYGWVEVVDDRLEVRTVAGGVDLPADYLTFADQQRVRAAYLGGVRATASAAGLAVTLTNPQPVAWEGTVRVQPGAWTLDAAAIPFRVEAGGTFTATVPATRPPAAWVLPSPRIGVDLPLGSGFVPLEVVADVVRDVPVTRGSAVIDGRLDEWSGAPSLGPLTTRFGEAPTAEATEVTLRYDADALYLAARCADNEPDALRRNHHGRDGHVVFDDRVGLKLSAPRPVGGDVVVWFYVNPNGAVWDLRRADGVVDRAWDGVQAAATVDEGGWSVEARIPFAEIGVSGPPDGWRVDVRRRQERTQTEATLTPGFGATDPARMAVLRVVEGAR